MKAKHCQLAPKKPFLKNFMIGLGKTPRIKSLLKVRNIMTRRRRGIEKIRYEIYVE